MKTLLVVGIGNRFRRDDGVGHAVAERFENWEKCDVLLTQQILPEHVDCLVDRKHVYFVDADLNANIVRLESLSCGFREPSLGHVGDPQWLLTICQALYGRSPQATLLRIPVEDMGYGEGLSEFANGQIEQAIAILQHDIPQRA